MLGKPLRGSIRSRVLVLLGFVAVAVGLSLIGLGLVRGTIAAGYQAKDPQNAAERRCDPLEGTAWYECVEVERVRSPVGALLHFAVPALLGVAIVGLGVFSLLWVDARRSRAGNQAPSSDQAGVAP